MSDKTLKYFDSTGKHSNICALGVVYLLLTQVSMWSAVQVSMKLMFTSACPAACPVQNEASPNAPVVPLFDPFFPMSCHQLVYYEQK